MVSKLWQYGPVRMGSLVLLVTIGIFSIPTGAQAFSSLLNAATSRYSHINGTRLDDCLLCHQSSSNPGSLNPYGRDFKNSGQNFDAIAALDSDGDGVINIDEINALTFPGNASDKPAVATATPLPTNTAIPATVTPLLTDTPTNGTPAPTHTPVAATATPNSTPCGINCFHIYIPIIQKQPHPQITVTTPSNGDDDDDEEDDDDDGNDRQKTP